MGNAVDNTLFIFNEFRNILDFTINIKDIYKCEYCNFTTEELKQRSFINIIQRNLLTELTADKIFSNEIYHLHCKSCKTEHLSVLCNIMSFPNILLIKVDKTEEM